MRDEAPAVSTQLSSVSATGGLFYQMTKNLRLDANVDAVLAHLADEGILGGYNLKQDYPELGECLLVCATETKLPEDIERYAQALARALDRS